ncbi:hypothetical protein ACH0DO_000765 [Enterococcus hirae]
MEWWNLWVPFGGTIIGIIVNVWINVSQNKKNQSFQEKMKQKEIDANLKAKARIEWISEVRNISSEIIIHTVSIQNVVRNYGLALKYYYNQKNITSINEQNIINSRKLIELQNKYKEYENEFYDKHNLVFSLCQKLLLFSETDEHRKIIQCIEAVYKNNDALAILTSDKNFDKKKFKELDSKYPDLIENFTTEIKRYLKVEWDKAKQGK